MRENLAAKRSFIQETDALVAKLDLGSGLNPRTVTRSSENPIVVMIGDHPEFDSFDSRSSNRLLEISKSEFVRMASIPPRLRGQVLCNASSPPASPRKRISWRINGSLGVKNGSAELVIEVNKIKIIDSTWMTIDLKKLIYYLIFNYDISGNAKPECLISH